MKYKDDLKRIMTIVLVLFLGVMMKQEVSGTEVTFLELEKGNTYTYDQLHYIAIKLSRAYPQILRYEYLGESFDKRSIFALIMTENESSLEPEVIYVERMHYMVDAGLHAREDINPVLVLKMIEDYAKAYTKNEKIQGVDLREVLGRSVLHFLPVTNPDGFELARQGLAAVKTEQARNALNHIKSTNYSNFKAGMSGVDLNRNFPSPFLNPYLGVFEDQWDTYKDNNLYSSQPASAFYAGPRAGSEPEVVILMDYMLRYDFRNYMSMHSRGEVLFWDNYNMPKNFRDRARALALEIDTFMGYEMGQPKSSVQMTGYASDFVAAKTLKPMITVESLPISTQLPTPQALYYDTYNKVKIIPLLAERVGRRTGYLDYRLYVGDRYVRDFDDLAYAIAHSIQLEGIIVKGEGIPIGYIGDYAMIKEGNVYQLSTYYPKDINEEINEESTEEIAGETTEEVNPDTQVIDEEQPTIERSYYEGYPTVHIKVEEADVVGDVPAILLNGRTMVPLRVVSEAFGANVVWDGADYTVYINKTEAIENQEKIEPMGSTYYKGLKMVNVVVGGRIMNSDVPAIILNGRTMVPLRVIGEVLGADIIWDQSTYTVSLTKQNPSDTTNKP
ncbi:conserved protein of unknown function [Petrocella atlantisensis]|uniref:Peptidase M14 domain-containing protein n=1 Tax=Petrocella atlantisensis TaxID=2173034 RepID=A0A3P7PXX9_9FIRM|nr:M14 family zinc carboxypeptidase [Petrocella atlantisensis]VDN48031.1 conserved protein of unknown function [Petrocella atlantisensis]